MDWGELEKYKHAEATLKPNYILIPTTVFNICPAGADEFNQVYKFILSQAGKMGKIVRTPSGGISFSRGKFFGNCWDIQKTRAGVELTVCKGLMWRFQFRYKQKKEDSKMYGGQAFKLFFRACREYGIDLNEYALTKEEGDAVKRTIPSTIIELGPAVRTGEDAIYQKVYHADFNSSFMAGLCNRHEEFRDVVTEIYNKRNNHKEYKALLNCTYGYMQLNRNPRWAHLSKDMVEDNNERVRELASRLKREGYRILAYNTDGIWYQDVYDIGRAYQGKGEGIGLGQWKTDHYNCIIRFKSKGAYEYIEDGQYTPVVRGSTLLDDVKERSQWVWGDIFTNKADVIQFSFNDNEGVVYDKETFGNK